MKKRISILMGLLLTVSVLASLLVAGTPVAAGTLGWSQEGDPATTRVVTTTERDIYNIAGDGTTMYAVASGNVTYKSTNGGTAWAALTTSSGILATMVAVAPDNADIVAVASGTAIYLSTNGGTTWGDVTGTVSGTIQTIDISPVLGSANKLGVGTATGMYFRSLSVTGAWGAAVTGFTGTAGVWALKFSPNYAADEAVTVVSSTSGATCSIYFEMYSTNTATWGAAADLAATVTNTSTTANVTHAAIALDANFLGSDSTSRLAFWGADTGVYRNTPTAAGVTYLSQSINCYSLAWDGTTLIASQAGTNVVQRSTNAADSGPTFAPTNTAKGPGYGTTAPTSVCAVYNASSYVIAGVNGLSPCISVSTDGGKAFNDIALVYAPMGTMSDMAVSADGSVAYLVTDNTTSIGVSSVWRYTATDGWQRILSLATDTYKVTIAPENADVVYVTCNNATAKTIYYSKDGGTEKWYTRAAKVVVDLVAESDTVAYYTNGSNVYKSANGAFTWGSPGDARVGTIATLTCLSAGNVLAGGSTGVAYTTDSNTNWSPTGSLAVGADYVTASGMTTDSYIYAAKAAAVYRWKVGTSTSTGTWTTLTSAFAAGSITNIKGLGMMSGALYAISDNLTAERAVAPTSGGGDFILINDTAHLNAATLFNGMALSSGNKLWGLDDGYNALWSYTDTLVSLVPTLSSPANGAKIGTNALSGNVYTVSFTWPNDTGVTAYQYQVYTDADCTQPYIAATTAAVISGTATTTALSAVGFNPGSTYYWRIRASTPLTSAWSAAFKFTTDTAGLIVPTLVAPVNGSSITNTTPAFTWSPISGATSYSLQYSTFATFPDSLTTTVTATTTAYLPPTALDLGTYFWRVKAAAPVAGEWSATGTFTLAAPETSTPSTVIATATIPSITIPSITVPTPSVTVVMPETKSTVSPALLWAVIIIGAVLVIALIVLIVRTRRNV